MAMRTRIRFAAAWPLVGPLAAALIGWGAAGASAATLNAEYAISLAGLSVGTADLSAKIEGQGYRMDIQARLTGLAGALTGGSGGAAAAGTVAGNRPLPTS